MNKNLREKFYNPPADVRSLPFWAWNGRMDAEELKSQVRQMKQAGVGGFFIHSRIGLETEYMGPEWMACVAAVVEEAKEQGLNVWLYDEDRWPSGTAGGKVTACGDAYRCKGLTLEVLTGSDYEKLYREELQEQIQNGQNRGAFSDEQTGLVAVYRAVLCEREEECDERPAGIVSFERLSLQEKSVFVERTDFAEKDDLAEQMFFSEQEAFTDREVFLVVRLEVSAPSEWFNNEAPPDNLNPDCVKCFIQETHEKYKAVVGEEFGKTIRGIFTDEPSLNDRFSYFGENKSWIPWTYGFGAYFEQVTGYDFLEVLPLFYFQGENSAKVRHDYWKSITLRYSESYFKTISEWCEQNNLLFTGHFLQEDKMGLAARVNGAVMPHYRYQHIPGIDMLCEQTKEYMTVKQCTGVANQLGRKQVLSETYGCTGWEFTFEGQKWMGDWQYVLGVNRRCQHLALYSLRGCRKRDYPPSFNYNTNWWMENRIVEDYFARLAVVLEQGEAVRDILLLHPASTVWSQLGVNPYGNPVRRKERDVPKLNAYGDKLNALIEYLERQHLDCDLGDELLIAEYGRVEVVDATADVQNPNFIVGQAKYRAVVLPSMETILYSTAVKLLEYMNQGGKVYVLEKAPRLFDGESKEPELLAKLTSHAHWVTVGTNDALIQALECYRRISIEAAEGQECSDVLYQLRKDNEKYYLFVVNNNRHRAVDAVIRFPSAVQPLQLELLSGEITEVVSYENNAEGMTMPLHLGKTGSALFCLQPVKVQTLALSGYRLNRANVLPLDICQYRMEEAARSEEPEAWSEKQEIWMAQKAIREKLGMRSILHNGIEQRYKWIERPHVNDGCKVALLFTFRADCKIEGATLAMETSERFTIALNGKEVPWKDAGWTLDKEIRKCVLPDIVQGENQLLLTCHYKNDMELENIYIEGNFGVTGERTLTELPTQLAPGSWTEQGLKHYCGSVTYVMEYICNAPGDKVFLQLPAIAAVCVKVRVNKQEILIPWDFERELCIGDWLHSGSNRIEVEVVGSPRNMMGPFHLKAKPYNTNDGSFAPSPEKYSAEYLLQEYGLMGDVQIRAI